MADVSRSGRTILFVSHNLAAVQKLCTRAVLLEQGTLKYDGTTDECIEKYLHGARKSHTEFLGYTLAREMLEPQPENARIRVTDVEMFDSRQQPLQQLNTNDGFTLRIHYKSDGSFARGAVAFMVSIKTHLGQEICRLSNMPISGYPIEELARVGYLDLTINSLPLVGGRYFIDLKIFRPAVETILQLPEIVVFEVAATDVYKSGIGMDQQRGLFVVNHRWNHCVTEPQRQLQPAK
jgi:lipopolysaccharide transport system ATP-binding protein